MVIGIGEKVHVITRRLFESDLRRHFAGIVIEVADSSIRAKGFTFVFDQSTNEFVRREEERVRIFTLTDAGIVINLLPVDAQLSNMKYQIDERGQRVVTDGVTFSLNISEFGSNR